MLREFLGPDARAARAAAHAFCGVIEGALRALGAYEKRSSWEDLMHDVLLALFEHGHSVKKPAAWLRRATFNAFIDTWRKEASHAARVRAFTHVQSMLGRDGPDLLLESSVRTKEQLEELRQAVARLPEDLRRIVEKVYPADPSRELATLADAASALGLAEHTVKNRLRRAIETLGRELRRERNLRRFRVLQEPPSAACAQRSRPPRPRRPGFGFMRLSDFTSARAPRMEE